MKTNSTSTPVTPSVSDEMLAEIAKTVAEIAAKTVAEMATKAVAEALKVQNVEALKASTPASPETTETPKTPETADKPWWAGMGEHFVCNTRNYKPCKAGTETTETQKTTKTTKTTKTSGLSEAQLRQRAEARAKLNAVIKTDREARFEEIKTNALRVNERKNGKKTTVEYFDKNGKCLATERNGKFTIHK